MKTLRCASKADKKAIKSFYHQQHYSAKFKGLDTSYLIEGTNDCAPEHRFERQNKPFKENAKEIIACVIISQLEPNNSQLFLHALVVNKNYQKNGLATQLLNYAITAKVKNSKEDITSIVCFCESSLISLYLKSHFICVSHEVLNPILNARYHTYLKKEPELKIMMFDV
jgi:N-acetylglutamate synthase-like GNAT family acetyltransferase